MAWTIAASSSTSLQPRAEFVFLFLPQAHVGGAVDGDAHAVAGLAKVLRDRRDEADVEAAVGGAEIARGAGAGQGGLNQVELCAQAFLHRLQVEVFGVLSGGAHRHRLDQPQHEAARHAERDHLVDLVVVAAGQRHHVELDRRKPGVLRGGEARHHFRQHVAAVDLFHPRLLQ